MKLKKKIILIASIMIFMVLLISQKSFAQNIDNKFYNLYIPDNYKKNYDDTDEDASLVTYLNEVGDGVIYSSVDCNIFKNYDNKPYTKTDMDGSVKQKKELYQKDEYFILDSINAKQVELNGVKGFYIIYKIKIDESDEFL